MDFILSNNEKIALRSSARKKLELEIYSAAIMVGIDPDSLEMVDGKFTWQPSSSGNEVIGDSWKTIVEKRLRQILTAYEKLIGLQN